jgi:hypothetical protein
MTKMCFVKIEFSTVACSDLVLALACLSLERVTRRVEGGRVARGRARSAVGARGLPSTGALG